MSGQGPYFGQRAWFVYYHSEKVDSAIERYGNEIRRVLGVIDAHLTKQGSLYLVGDKVTIADLAWVPWNELAIGLVKDLDFEKNFPKAWEWHRRLVTREVVKRALPAIPDRKGKNE